MSKKLSSLILLCLCVAVNLYGQAQTKPPSTLDSLIVTATRVPVYYKQTGRSVAVYTADEIKAQPAQTLAGLLRTLGGIAVQSRAGFGVQSDFTIRGSSFKGVLILLDGIPINGPQTAHYLSDFPVPLSAIARIEVMRGSASALYGANAIGGVIQIFTYAGLRSTNSSKVKTEGEVHTKYGLHELYDVGGSFRQSFGQTTVYGATVFQGTDGEAIFDNTGERVTSINGPLSTDFNRQTHTVAVTHPFGGAMLYARAGMDRRDLNAYHFYTGFASDKARTNNRTYWVQARLSNNLSEQTHWSFQIAGKQHEGQYVYNPKSLSAWDYARKLNTQFMVSRDVSNKLTLASGVSGEFRNIASIEKGDHTQFTGGVYVAAIWMPLTHLTVNASSRMDYDTGYGIELTPQVSIAYNIDTFTFRASGGRAVRAPTFTELYINSEIDDPSGNFGNPDLKAEQAWSTDAGIDFYITPGISFHSTVFYRSLDNLIDWSRLPNQDLYVARNILSAQTQGLELGFNARKAFSNSVVSFNAFYTLLHKEIQTTNKNADYKYALKGAKQFIQGSLKFDYKHITLALRGLWKDRRAKKSYTLIHTRVAYKLPFFNRLSLSAAVRNILDVHYSDIFDAPMPGRWWIFGLQWHL